MLLYVTLCYSILSALSALLCSALPCPALLCSALLCSALSLSLPPLLYSFSSFSILGCRVAGSPGRRVAGLPGTTASLPSSLPLRLGLCALEATRIYCQSPRWKWESALHHSKSHPAVKRDSVREERVREERRSKSSRKRGSDPNSEMHDDAASFNPSHIASAFPRVWYLARILIAISESSEGRARHSPLWCPFWNVSYKAPGTSVPVRMTMVFSYQDHPWILSSWTRPSYKAIFLNWSSLKRYITFVCSDIFMPEWYAQRHLKWESAHQSSHT